MCAVPGNVYNRGEHVENQNDEKKKEKRKEKEKQEGDEHEHANKQTKAGERKAVAQLNTQEMLVWWGKKLLNAPLDNNTNSHDVF